MRLWTRHQPSATRCADLRSSLPQAPFAAPCGSAGSRSGGSRPLDAFRAGEVVTWQRALSDDEANEFFARVLEPGFEAHPEKRDDQWYVVVASKTADGEVNRTTVPIGAPRPLTPWESLLEASDD